MDVDPQSIVTAGKTNTEKCQRNHTNFDSNWEKYMKTTKI
jgi:hypothetical protein